MGEYVRCCRNCGDARGCVRTHTCVRVCMCVCLCVFLFRTTECSGTKLRFRGRFSFTKICLLLENRVLPDLVNHQVCLHHFRLSPTTSVVSPLGLPGLSNSNLDLPFVSSQSLHLHPGDRRPTTTTDGLRRHHYCRFHVPDDVRGFVRV